MKQPSQASLMPSRRSERPRSERRRPERPRSARRRPERPAARPSAWFAARAAGAFSPGASVRASAVPSLAAVARDLQATSEPREVVS